LKGGLILFYTSARVFDFQALNEVRVYRIFRRMLYGMLLSLELVQSSSVMVKQ